MRGQPTRHRARIKDHLVTFRFGGPITVKVRAKDAKEAKATALPIAREAAAQICATAELDADTEAAVDDFQITVPNKGGIMIKEQKR